MIHDCDSMLLGSMRIVDSCPFEKDKAPANMPLCARISPSTHPPSFGINLANDLTFIDLRMALHCDTGR